MRQYNMINQKNNNDCAVACLMMILRYYKIKVVYDDLKSELRTTEEGTSAFDIVKVSNKYGLKAVGYKKYNIDNIKKPVIALIINKGISHYIVIYKVRKNSILIADPTSKIMSVNKEYFKKYYSGIIIKFINKTPKNKYITLILCYFIINIIIIIQNFTLLYIISKIISDIENQNIIFLKKYISLFILFYLLKIVFIYFSDIIATKLKSYIDRKVSLPFIYKSLSSKNNNLKTNLIGSLMEKYSDLNYIKDLYFKFITIYIINIIFILISIISLGLINFNICFLLMAYLILIFIFNYKYYSKNYYKILEYQNLKEIYLSKMTDVFNNINMIKNLKKEKYFYNRINKEYNNFMIYLKKVENSISFKNLINNLLVLFLITYLICYVINSNINFSNFFYIYSLIMIIINILDDFIYELPNIMNYKAIKERIKQINMNEVCVKSKFKFNKKFQIQNNQFTFFHNIDDSKKIEILSYIKNEIKDYTYINIEQHIFDGSIIDNIFMEKKLNKKILSMCLINKIIKKYNLDYKTNINGNYISILRNDKVKILIARALANSYKYIVFDEVFDYLSDEETVIIFNNIKRYFPKLVIIVFSNRISESNLF